MNHFLVKRGLLNLNLIITSITDDNDDDDDDGDEDSFGLVFIFTNCLIPCYYFI